MLAGKVLARSAAGEEQRNADVQVWTSIVKDGREGEDRGAVTGSGEGQEGEWDHRGGSFLLRDEVQVSCIMDHGDLGARRATSKGHL